MGKVRDFLSGLFGRRRKRATSPLPSGPQPKWVTCKGCGREALEVRSNLGCLVLPDDWQKFATTKPDPEQPGQAEILYFCPKAGCRSQLTWRTWTTMKEGA